MNAIITILKKIVESIVMIVVYFLLWGVLCIGITLAMQWFTTESYQPHDLPDERFQVVLQNSDGSTQPKTWNIAKTQPQAWVRIADTECKQEDCLYANADGSFTFHSEGAMWYIESRYRIEGEKIIPISFNMFTGIHVFMAMVLAFITLGIGKSLLGRWLSYQSTKDKIIDKV